MPPILRTLVLTSAAAVLFNIMSPRSALIESLFKKRGDNKPKPTLSLTSIVQKSEASAEEALIIPLPDEMMPPPDYIPGTYKVIFRWVDPETPEEKGMFEKYKDNPLKWMDWLRTQANPDWWIAVAKVTTDIANKTINLSNLESLYRKNLRLYELSPYIGRIGYGAYQDADITHTRTFSGKPVYYQELKTGKLIPLEISEDGVVKKSISLTEWLIEKSKWYSGSLAKAVKKSKDVKTIYRAGFENIDEVFKKEKESRKILSKTFSHSCFCFTLSNDGKKVGFVGKASHTKDRYPKFSYDVPYEIYISNVDGTGLMRISDNELYESCVGWSPNDEKIAYFTFPRNIEKHLNFAVLNILDLKRKKNKEIHFEDLIVRFKDSTLQPGYIKRIVYSPQFSPDGEKIVFYSKLIDKAKGGTFREVFTSNLNNGKLEKIANLDFELDEDKPLAWSADGRELILAGSHEHKRYHKIVLDNLLLGVLEESEELKELPSKLAIDLRYNKYNEIFLTDGLRSINLTKNPAHDVFPSFSPDGKKIAFVSDRDGFPELYVMNSDGSNPEKLTDSRYYKRSRRHKEMTILKWLDSKKILFDVYIAHNVWGDFLGIYLKDLEGGLSLIGNYSGEVSFSPNGKKVAIADNGYITSVNIKGIKLQNRLLHVKKDKMLGFSPRWSPDGDYIAFARLPPPERSEFEGFERKKEVMGIYLLNPHNREKKIVINGVIVSDLAWSPNSKALAYLIEKEIDTMPWPAYELYSINVNGKNNKRLLEILPPTKDYRVSTHKIEWVNQKEVSILYSAPPKGTKLDLINVNSGKRKTLLEMDRVPHSFSWSPNR